MPSDFISEGCTSAPTITVMGGAPKSPSASHVPAGAREHRVARGGERREVGHGGAGDERAAAVRRQVEQLDAASAARLFQELRPGVARVRPAFWSQAPASQLAASADRQRAADHEAEEAPPGGGERRAGHGPVEERKRCAGFAALRG